MNVSVTFAMPPEPDPEPDVVVVAEPGRWGWFHMQHPDPTVMQIHLLPTYDCGMHAFDAMCACRPNEEQPGFFSHNAFDGRESYEQTGRKKH